MSDRDRVLQALREAGPAGLHSLAMRRRGLTGNPSQRVRELRDRGYRIDASSTPWKDDNGRRRPGTTYTLIGEAPQEGARTTECGHCGVEFTFYGAHTRQFCSRTCIHEARLPRDLPEPNPSGLCLCGCGERTPIAKKSIPKRQHVKGKPLRYVPGHQTRKSPEQYAVDDESGCWVWQRGISQGYGTVQVDGKSWQAHRYVYVQHRGEIPDGFDLHHRCGNRSCVNPAHLEPMDRGEHTRLHNYTRNAEPEAGALFELPSYMDPDAYDSEAA